MDKDQQRRAVRVSDLTEKEMAMITAAEVPTEFDYEVDEGDQSEARQQFPIRDTKTPQ